MKKIMILVAIATYIGTIQPSVTHYFTVKNKLGESIQLAGSSGRRHNDIIDPPSTNPQITIPAGKIALCKLTVATDDLRWKDEERVYIYRSSNTKCNQTTQDHCDYFDIIGDYTDDKLSTKKKPKWIEYSYGLPDHYTIKPEGGEFCVLMDE